MRTETIERLGQIKDRFVALLQGNWAPDDVDKVFDLALMPVFVAAENARNPALKLALLESPVTFKEWLVEKCPPDGGRVLFTLPGPYDHSTVADVRRVDGKTSILLVEPLSLDNDLVLTYDTKVLPDLRRMLPRQTTLAMMVLGTQRAETGCRIFALASASKLAGARTEVEQLHRENLAGSRLNTSQGFPARQIGGTRQVRLFDGEGLLTPAFMKHAQSSTGLRAWLDGSSKGRAEEAVNKKGQTLVGRYEANLVERYDLKPPPRNEQDPGASRLAMSPQSINNSIEQKRVVLIDRAMDYLRHAPEAECQAFHERLRGLGITEDTTRDLAVGTRRWAPDLTQRA